MKRTSIFLLCIFIFLYGCNKKEFSLTSQKSIGTKSKHDNTLFKEFWTTFRILCINKNYQDLKPLAEFPLATRGPMDFHPVIKFSKNDFPKVFSLFLEEPTGMDVELKEKNIDYIKNNETIHFSDIKVPLLKGEWARITDMEFTKRNSQWKLSFLFLSEEAYDKLGINISQ